MDILLLVVYSGLILSWVRISFFFTFGFGDVWMYVLFKFDTDLDFHLLLSLLPSSFSIFNLFCWALIRLQYTINPMVYCLITYFQARHTSCLIPHELTKTAFTAIWLDEIADQNILLKLNGRNARICKTYFLMDVINFFRSICKKQQLFISWNCAEK